MSTITSDTELEQAIAAAELSDEEAADVLRLLEETDASAEELIAAAIASRDAEPEVAPAAKPEPLASEPSEKQLRALDQENTKHVQKVHTIMGHFAADLVECDKCGSMGLVEPGPEAKPHPFYVVCGTCNGFGQVLTGSLVEAQIGVNCPDCAGRGYLEAMLDNTPATEIVERYREQARLAAPAPLEPAPPGAATLEPAPMTHGKPAWMGDTTISS